MFHPPTRPPRPPRLLPDGVVVDVVRGELSTQPATEATLSPQGMHAAIGGELDLILTIRSRHRAGVAIACYADEHAEERGHRRNALIEIGVGGYLEIHGPMRWVALTRGTGAEAVFSALSPAEARDLRLLHVPGKRAPIVQLRGVSPAWPADPPPGRAGDPDDPHDA